MLTSMPLGVRAQDVSTPPDIQTWQIGPCVWTGRVDGEVLREAHGHCGTHAVFARVTTRQSSQDAAVKGPFGVLRAANLTWTDESLIATDGAVSTPQFTLRGLNLTFDLVDGRIRVLSPGRQGMVESEES